MPVPSELFLHGKAMVPYVQLSTYLRIGFWYNEKIIVDWYNFQANSWLTTAHTVPKLSRV